MIKFLINRPIAVLMSVLAFVILGILSYFSMPVSLLPDIDIPHLKVQISYPKNNARSIENTITRPLRQQLSQLSGLKSIHSESREGAAEIRLEFDYNTKTDFAFFEANEKIDGIISQLPKDLIRPLVIKEKPSDIPVFYLSIVPNQEFYAQGRTYHEFSEFAKNDIRRRLEQHDEISMVDISGVSYKQIIVEPNSNLLNSHGIHYNDITNLINNNHLKTESLKFSKGYYTYNLRLLSPELSIDFIKNLKISKNDKVFKLEDIANIKEAYGNSNTRFYHNYEQGISMAVYKHSAAKMSDAKTKISSTIEYMEEQYPLIHFSVERDQTKLLQYSINNLIQTLILSVLLSSLLIIVFFRKKNLSIIIGISIPITIIISLFFLQLVNIDINIISLSGLVLSVGLMIDNSIIVLDNINQYKQELSLQESIIKGTNEIIRPLLSSVLTTIAVFLPLITISGISGALFYDQAVTISISLLSSFFVSIILVPVLYNLFVSDKTKYFNSKLSIVLLSIYDKALSHFLKKKTLIIAPIIILIVVGFILLQRIEKEKLPYLSQTDLICKINWNENISLGESENRIRNYINKLSPSPYITSTYLGENEFLYSGYQSTKESVVLYFDYKDVIDYGSYSNRLIEIFNREYPNSIIEIEKSDNIFNRIFENSTNELFAKIRLNDSKTIDENEIFYINDKLSSIDFIETYLNDNKSSFIINTDYEKLLLYKLNYSELIYKLKVLFGGSQLDELNQNNQSIKLILQEKTIDIVSSINTETIANSEGIQIPLSSVISIEQSNTPNSILADQLGEYVGCSSLTDIDKGYFRELLKNTFSSFEDINITIRDIDGENRSLFAELLKVLIVSLLLLYLILAAQFESLVLPIIILIELIIDICGSLLFLYIFDISLNIMSGLGLIVMSGIIINDSIIKIDTIHKTFKETGDLNKAIKIGGHRRFLPIVMTSVTTILALLPLLFFSGMGVELQLPLAISIVGGLSLGTLISLFLIPVLYSFYAKYIHFIKIRKSKYAN